MKAKRAAQFFPIRVIWILAVLGLAALQVSSASAQKNGSNAPSARNAGDASLPEWARSGSIPAPRTAATPMAEEGLFRTEPGAREEIATPQLAAVGSGGGGGGLGGKYDHWWGTPPPKSAPPPPAEGTTVITSISESVTNVFHHLVFPVQTISDALLEIFKSALNKEQDVTLAQEELWVGSFNSLFQAPPAGAYTGIADGGLKVAAGIAVALFILRLAIYNWSRMLGDDDDAVHVVGDWLTAGVLALAAGPLLDLINRIGWWIMGAVLGNASTLAHTFVEGLLKTTLGGVLENTTFIGPILMIALMIASMLAVIGIIVAFASGQAVMYVLAAVGPVVMVAGVIPRIRWLRGMWLQATVVVALLPVVAAAVFKAGIGAAAYLNGGLAQEIFRILWLFGVTGFLLSLSGILGKFTIGAAGDTIGKLARVGKAIIETAVMAGGAAAAGGGASTGAGALPGSGQPLGGGGGAGAAVLEGGGAPSGSTGSAAAGFPASSPHLSNALGGPGRSEGGSLGGGLESRSGSGLPNHYPEGAQGVGSALANHYRRPAPSREIEARSADLERRVEEAASLHPMSPGAGFGYSPAVNTALANHYPGPAGAKVFNEGLAGLSPFLARGLQGSSLTPDALMLSHTNDMMKLVDTWNAFPSFGGSDEPLSSVIDVAGVSAEFKSLFEGT